MTDTGNGDWSDNNGGPEFMALRANVRRKRREIRKDLTPSQNYLLDDIQEGTINDWDSENEFDLDDLAKGLGYKSTDKVYQMLKQLHLKKIITRKPTKYPRREVLGLNSEYFGQILTNHQHGIEKRRHLSVVPKELTVCKLPAYESKVDNLRTVSQSLLNRKSIEDQASNMIEENPPLDSYRLDRSLRCESGEDSDESKWDPKGPEKARAIRDLIRRSLP